LGRVERLLADGAWQVEPATGEPRRARFRWTSRSPAERAAVVEGLAGRAVPEPEWEAVLLESFLASRAAASIVALELHVTFVDATLNRALAALVSRRRPALSHLVIATQPFDVRRADPVEPRVPVATADALRDALPGLGRLDLRGHGLLPRLSHPGIARLHLAGYRALRGCGVLEAIPEHDLPALQELEIAVPRAAVPFVQRGRPALGVRPGALRHLDLRGLAGWFDPASRDGASVGAFLSDLADRGWLGDLTWLGLPALREVDGVHLAHWLARVPGLQTLAVDHVDASLRADLERRVPEVSVGERAAVWVDTIEAGTAHERLRDRPPEGSGIVERLVAACGDDVAALRELVDTLPGGWRTWPAAVLRRRETEAHAAPPGLPAGAVARLGRPADVPAPLDTAWPRIHQDGTRVHIGALAVETVHDARTALGADGRLAAIEGPSGRAWVIDTVTGARHEVAGEPGGLRGLALSPDGGALAMVGASRRLTVVDWRTGARRGAMTLPHPGGPLAFSGDDWLVVGGDDGTVSLVDPARDQRIATFRGHQGPVVLVAASADGRYAATTDQPPRRPSRTLLLDLRRLCESAVLEGDEAPSPRGELRFAHGRLEARYGPGVRAFDPATGRRLRARDRLGRIDELAASPDGRRVLTAPDLTLWDLPAMRPLLRIGAARRGPGAIAFPPRSEGFAVRRDRQVTVWSSEGADPRPIGGPDALGVTFTGAGDLLIAHDAGLSAWSAEGAKRWEIALPLRPHRLVAGPDGRGGEQVVIAADGSHLVTIDPVTGAPRGETSEATEGFPTALEGLALRRDGTVVAVSRGQTRRYRAGDLTRLADGEPLPPDATAVTWSADGETVAFAVPGAIGVRASGATLTLHPPPRHEPTALTFAGNVLLSAGRDRTVLAWALGPDGFRPRG